MLEVEITVLINQHWPAFKHEPSVRPHDLAHRINLNTLRGGIDDQSEVDAGGTVLRKCFPQIGLHRK